MLLVGSDWTIPSREEQLRTTANEELPMLVLADDASRLVAEVVQRIKIDATSEDRSARDYRVQALWFMAIIALRALRAAMQALRSGYEDQSVGFQRLIDELHNRAQKVRGDHSGDYARQWLEGRGLGKGAKLAGQEFWEFLSGPVHANARAVFDWMAVSEPDGSAKIVIGPERRPEMANPALVFMASEARELATVLALEAGVVLDISDLDDRIRQAFETWIPGNDDE
jgi:hypothetical protein